MAIPLAYEQVKNKINNDNSGCVLDMTESEVLSLMQNENKSMSNIKFKIKCGCKNNAVFYTTFGNFNNKKHPKKQCNICGEKIKLINKTKTTDKFKKEVLELVGTDYEVLTEYISAKDDIMIRHICGYEFPKTPDSFLGHGDRRGARCPKCEGLIRNKTTDYFKEEVFNLVGNEYEVLGEYITSDTLILMKHSLCGREYDVTPNSFLYGRRCPVCNESKGEQKIRYYFENNNINFTPQFIYGDLLSDKGNPLKFDFAIFYDKLKINLKYLIEYDGEFHYEVIKLCKNESIEVAEERLKKQQYHDRLKNEYCENNNIKLIRIPYWEFDSLENILEDIIIKNNIRSEYIIQNNINNVVCVS